MVEVENPEILGVGGNFAKKFNGLSFAALETSTQVRILEIQIISQTITFYLYEVHY
jgi:hypothetical protein